MSPRMTEADWVNALEVFRASLPRRGARGRDDRLFLEALHYFSVHNITWRALPERFGKWNSVWKRFDRLSKAGVFETFFDHLASLSSSAHLVQMFDSTVVRAHVSAAGRKRGQDGQALGRSRGGFSTKIHLKTDFDGHPIAFDLTGGEKGDAPHFPVLLGLGPDVDPRAAIGDKGYASKANRRAARERGIVPVIPHKANEKDKPAFFARTLYKGRARIEQAAGKLKRFKRVALRCEKTKRNFASFVALTAGFILLKSVHTAQQAKPVRANGRRQPVDLLHRIGSASATRSVVGEEFIAVVLDGGGSHGRPARFQLRSGPVEFGVELRQNGVSVPLGGRSISAERLAKRALADDRAKLFRDRYPCEISSSKDLDILHQRPSGTGSVIRFVTG